jgi:hypothetical protein
MVLEAGIGSEEAAAVATRAARSMSGLGQRQAASQALRARLVGVRRETSRLASEYGLC